MSLLTFRPDAAETVALAGGLTALPAPCAIVSDAGEAGANGVRGPDGQAGLNDECGGSTFDPLHRALGFLNVLRRV